MQPFWQRLFETWDPGETGIPIRIVYPFFDRRLVELLFAFPPMPWFARKYLLREAMKGRLPEEVRRRPKTPMAGDPLRIVMRRSTGQLRGILDAVPEMANFIDAANCSTISRSIRATEAAISWPRFPFAWPGGGARARQPKPALLMHSWDHPHIDHEEKDLRTAEADRVWRHPPTDPRVCTLFPNKDGGPNNTKT